MGSEFTQGRSFSRALHPKTAVRLSAIDWPSVSIASMAQIIIIISWKLQQNKKNKQSKEKNKPTSHHN
jgi:hypothetical protein